MKIRTLYLLFLFIFCAGEIHAQAVDSARLKAEEENLRRSQEQLINEMDAMLDSWYIKHSQANAKSVLSSYSDTNHVDDSNCDSIYKQRLKSLHSPIQLAYNSTVKSYINLYANTRKRSSSALLGLAQYYYPRMSAIFDKYGVPEELIYLTIIESSLNPTAVSPAGATGIWQFMYPTGKMYGLEQNTFIDDRRDPMKATDAAARHLRDLYNIFNDWGLAISAYNCGAGNVRKAIARSGGKTNFWEVRAYLPRETQNYFPSYIGAYYMMKFHNAHGIKPAPINIPLNVDTVYVKKEVHFEQISHVLNISMDEIKSLNPQYKLNVIPAFDKPYVLRLRANDIIRFEKMQDSIYKYEYDTYFGPLQMYVNTFTGKDDGGTTSKKKYHTVRSGESLSKIASKYGISITELKKMNNLKSNYLKAGQKLVVGYTYVAKPASDSTANTATADSTAKATTAIDSTALNATAPTKTTTTTTSSQTTSSSSSSSAKYTTYVVKKGDTLAKIAAAHKTTVKKLASYNNITNINSLRVGQKIKIPK